MNLEILEDHVEPSISDTSYLQQLVKRTLINHYQRINTVHGPRTYVNVDTADCFFLFSLCVFVQLHVESSCPPPATIAERETVDISPPKDSCCGFHYFQTTLFLSSSVVFKRKSNPNLCYLPFQRLKIYYVFSLRKF